MNGWLIGGLVDVEDLGARMSKRAAAAGGEGALDVRQMPRTAPLWKSERSRDDTHAERLCVRDSARVRSAMPCSQPQLCVLAPQARVARRW